MRRAGGQGPGGSLVRLGARSHPGAQKLRGLSFCLSLLGLLLPITSAPVLTLAEHRDRPLQSRPPGVDGQRGDVQRGQGSRAQRARALNMQCDGPRQFGTAEAVALLRRGDRAERTAAYSGIKVIRAVDPCAAKPGAQAKDRRGHGSGSSDNYERSVRIWHGGPGQTRLEFIQPEGDLARVVIENGARCWYFSPHRHAWRPITWRAPEPRLDLLLKNYRVAPSTLDRIGGRLALQVRIEPRYRGNPRKHSWLDLATGIALRSDLYDSSGRLVSTAEFRHFRPETCLPPSLFHIPAEAILPGREEDANERLSFDPALPRYLPHGYVLDRLTRSRRSGVEVVRARFTDGLNVLSLVQWRGGRDPGDRGSERFWGPGERIRWNLGPLAATLAGDLRTTELHRIVASIRPPTASGSLVSRK